MDLIIVEGGYTRRDAEVSIDADTLRLAEDLIASAKTCRFGQLWVEVTTRYLVDVRDGKVVAAAMKEVLPRVTIEQLRKNESIIE